MFCLTDIVVDNCAICRNHIMDLCKLVNIKPCVYVYWGTPGYMVFILGEFLWCPISIRSHTTGVRVWERVVHIEL